VIIDLSSVKDQDKEEYSTGTSLDVHSKKYESNTDSTLDSSKESTQVVPTGFKRNISFSTLEVRTYDVTLGDNPGGSGGPLVSLDWYYDKTQTKKIDLDSYEKERKHIRRNKEQLYLSPHARWLHLATEYNISTAELKLATEEANELRNKRDKTKHGSNSMVRVGKKLKRILQFQRK